MKREETEDGQLTKGWVLVQVSHEGKDDVPPRQEDKDGAGDAQGVDVLEQCLHQLKAHVLLAHCGQRVLRGIRVVAGLDVVQVLFWLVPWQLLLLVLGVEMQSNVWERR